MKTIIYAGAELPPILRVMSKAYSLSDVTIVANNIHDYYLSGLKIMHETDNAILLLSKFKEGIDSYTLQGILEKFGVKTSIPTSDAKIGIAFYREGKLKNDRDLVSIHRDLCKALQLKTSVIPFTDREVTATVKAGEGEMSLLEYFTAKKEFNVKKLELEGMEKIKPFEQVVKVIKDSESILIMPNDPVSIIPLIKNKNIQEAIEKCQGHVTAICPPITRKSTLLLETLGIEPTPLGVAKTFEEHIDTFLVERNYQDLKPQMELLKMEVVATDLYETEAEYGNTIPKPIQELFPLETKAPPVITGLKKGVQKIGKILGTPEKTKEQE
ncbi:MAG: 2-phospho-L-lactate transferase CofD family protein [Candidatus Jordarchaeaceae archaeon]